MGRKQPCRAHFEAQQSQGSALKVTPLRQWENRAGRCKSHRGHWRQIPELQDTFGTLAGTLANLLYPCKGWLGTSASAPLITLLLPAYLRWILLCTWVFICARNWVCVSPFLSSSFDLSGKDHPGISGLLLGLFHTPRVMLLCVLNATQVAIAPCIPGWAFTQFPALHSIHRFCQWPQCLQQDQDTGALTLNFQRKLVISNGFTSQKIPWQNWLR